MKDIKLVKEITDLNSVYIGTKGRPKDRWRDEVINDLIKLKPRNWIQLIKDREVVVVVVVVAIVVWTIYSLLLAPSVKPVPFPLIVIVLSTLHYTPYNCENSSVFRRFRKISKEDY